MTFDNGLEFANNEIISKKLETAIYFSNPYLSGEKRINENVSVTMQNLHILIEVNMKEKEGQKVRRKLKILAHIQEGNNISKTCCY
ncbi:hypothetical protein C5468_24650 [Photorhabdus luminescens subsp. mexicana]|uniref:Integrase catalytic domain-containing protein n=2 Tax=Photorhabdus luminescens TaxID=29488 RepID=A0A4R4IPQ5_PHOLU|nr:hypothetical protein C5468_24650 [Photorhabdus luminescens subsp. mexicana]